MVSIMLYQAIVGIIGLNFQEVKEGEELLNTIEQMERVIFIIIQLYDAMKLLYSISSFCTGMTMGNLTLRYKTVPNQRLCLCSGY